MKQENNNVNFNQLSNKNNGIDLGNLFANNSDNVFMDSNTEMISVNNINSIYSQNSVNMVNNSVNVGTNMEVINNTNMTSDLGVGTPVDVIDNNVKSKNGIGNVLNNRKLYLWLFILIFIFTSITVGKTFYLRNKVDNYEEFFVEIGEKMSEETVVYMEEEILSDSLKNVAASELISCINSSIDVNNLPNGITSIIDEINSYYNQSNNYFAFKYKDIYTGFSISYNENQNIFTASTIKAPKDIYIYEMASLGKINLDDTLTYTSRYANTGAWELKKKSFNTNYDIRTLVRYSTVASDNAAHNMLMDNFGRTNMLAFWQEKGTSAIFTANNNWGITNAHDASIYMEELYRFYVENEEYGQELMNNFLNADPKFVKGKNNYKVANKSGWAGTAIHDVSIVFADNPYIIVALSNLGETDYYMSYFNKANDFAYRLHTEYWKYKMDTCGNIDQY